VGTKGGGEVGSKENSADDAGEDQSSEGATVKVEECVG
jgi:hypothetical protein